MEYPEKYLNGWQDGWNKIYNYAKDGIIFSLEGHPFTLQGQKGNVQRNIWMDGKKDITMQETE